MIVLLITRIVLNNLDLSIQEKKNFASPTMSFTVEHSWPHWELNKQSYGNTFRLLPARAVTPYMHY